MALQIADNLDTFPNVLTCGREVLGQVKAIAPLFGAAGQQSGIVMLVKRAKLAAISALAGERRRFAYHEAAGTLSFSAIMRTIRPLDHGQASFDLMDLTDERVLMTQGHG